MSRITGVFDQYAVILDPHTADQLARDRQALHARTAGQARALRPSAEVLRLLGDQDDQELNGLSRHPTVLQGLVPAHPLNIMRHDPLLDTAGQTVQSAFLGNARLIPAADLDRLEAEHGWQRDQTLINRACGLSVPR